MPVKFCFDFLGFSNDLFRVEIVHARHRIVIVELNAVKTQLLIGLQLFVEGNTFADSRTERIRTFMNVPRTKRESERAFHNNTPYVCFVFRYSNLGFCADTLHPLLPYKQWMHLQITCIFQQNRQRRQFSLLSSSNKAFTSSE